MVLYEAVEHKRRSSGQRRVFVRSVLRIQMSRKATHVALLMQASIARMGRRGLGLDRGRLGFQQR